MTILIDHLTAAASQLREPTAGTAWPISETPACRPLEDLATAGKRYPEAWALIDHFRAGRGTGFPDWADWCFIPIAAGQTVVAEAMGIEITALPFIYPARAPDGARLAALAAWRVTQGIYQFAPELYTRLLSAPIHLEMTHEVLFHLPEWCVYIETPHIPIWGNERVHGVFAHLECDENDHRPELRFLLDTDVRLIACALHLGPWSIVESIERAVVEARHFNQSITSEVAEELVEQLRPLVSLVLYLAVEQQAIRNKRGTTPARPSAKKVRGQWRIPPAIRPTYWRVVDDSHL